MTFCNQCGKPIDEGSRFCAGCGALQKAADSAAPPEPSSPPQNYAPQDSPYAPQDASYSAPQNYAPQDSPYAPQDTPYSAPQNYAPHDSPYAPQDASYSAPQNYALQDSPYAPQQSQYTAPGSSYVPPQPHYTPPDPQHPGSSGYPAPDSGSYYPGAMSDTKKKPGKFLLIGVPIMAVVVIAAAVFALFFFRATPLIAAAKSLSNLGTEAAERFDSTPFKSILMLGDTLKDGTLSVDFDYRNWGEQVAGGSVTLASNSEARDYAISADLSVDGSPFDAEFFMNKERIAFGSSQIGSNYYGFKYGTFRSDVRTFGELMWLDDEEMDTMSDIVEMLGEMMNMEYENEDYTKQYADVMSKFMNNCEVKSERDSVESGGSSTRCTRVDIVIPDEALFALFEDYIQLVEDNDLPEKYTDLFNNASVFDVLGNVSNSFDDAIRDLRRASREFERNYSGDITISMFVGSRNRLLRAIVNADIRYDGDRTRIKCTFDFGSSATDRWTMNTTVTTDYNKTSVKLVWDYRERSNAIENTLTISADDSDPATLRSSWSPERGNFTLSFEQYGDESEISGVFKPSDDGFRLSFDNLLRESGYYDQSLTIEINAKSGARIKQVDFINIDKWDEELLEEMGNIFGSAISVPDPPYGLSGTGYISGTGGDVFVPQPTEYSFTPHYSGLWEIYTWDNGSSDPYISIYDSWGDYVGSDDDSGGDYNAYLEVYLESGESYTITVDFYSYDPGDYCMLSVQQY